MKMITTYTQQQIEREIRDIKHQIHRNHVERKDLNETLDFWMGELSELMSSGAKKGKE